MALVAALVACAHWASAEPRLRPSITITEEFSDNIDLEPDNEQSAFVTRVIPGLSFRGDTSRFTGGFDGAVATRYATAGQDSGFQVNGGLTADGDLQLVRDRLSLEGRLQSASRCSITSKRRPRPIWIRCRSTRSAPCC